MWGVVFFFMLQQLGFIDLRLSACCCDAMISVSQLPFPSPSRISTAIPKGKCYCSETFLCIIIETNNANISMKCIKYTVEL